MYITLAGSIILLVSFTLSLHAIDLVYHLDKVLYHPKDWRIHWSLREAAKKRSSICGPATKALPHPLSLVAKKFFHNFFLEL